MAADAQRPAERVELSELRLSRRFDIAIKYWYARARVTGQLTAFHRRTYEEHIRVFNAFTEVDASGEVKKLGSKAFVDSFDALIDSIASDGFDQAHPVPLSSDRTPVNGAHRVAACLAADVAPFATSTPTGSDVDYGYRYFARAGLAPEHMDAGAMGYVDLRSRLHMLVVFGAAIQHAPHIVSELVSVGDVLYERRLSLGRLGQDNLIRVLYDGERWLGKREQGYLGARGKARPCFPPGSPSRAAVILFERHGELGELVEFKERVRAGIGMGNHSFHITDTPHEVATIAPYVFTRNGRHLLDNRRYAYLSAFERDFAELRAQIDGCPLEARAFAVVGSAALALYGVRDSRDIDVVVDARHVARARELGFSTGNDHWKRYGVEPDSIVHDPDCHLIYKGIKFVSLDVLAALKRTRDEPKDRVDLSLIDMLLRKDDSIRARATRLVRLAQLYSNPRWLRSYVGHWLTRLGVRVRRARR